MLFDRSSLKGCDLHAVATSPDGPFTVKPE
jgi:hypothetical protein